LRAADPAAGRRHRRAATLTAVRVAVYNAKSYDRDSLDAINVALAHELRYHEARLDLDTAALADGVDAACIFVNDRADAPVLERLAAGGVRILALRCAGHNHVDLDAAARLGIAVTHVPAYSPNAVAEHTIALILALNRRIHKAYNRVREGNFALDGLLGFDLVGKTAGVVGTGRIGTIVARLLWHFRCTVLASDPFPNDLVTELGIEYVPVERIWAESDLITLNTPLTTGTYHLVDASVVAQLKPGAMLVNTGRGALIDAAAAIDGLKSGRIGSLALDVYEEEAELFFEDRSDEILDDDVFARLLTFPNVLITAHQAFFTGEALAAIAESTLGSLAALEADERPPTLLIG
jgi:D-lactate dehydrogenase